LDFYFSLQGFEKIKGIRNVKAFQQLISKGDCAIIVHCEL